MFRVQGDFTVGANMPVYSGEEAGRNMIVVNPQVFGEVGMRNHVIFAIGPV